MQSSNPIFNNAEGFNGRSAQQYGHQAYAAGGQGYAGYGQQTGYSDPSTWQYPASASPQLADRMTIDSVVARTGMVLGLVIASAVATWFFFDTPAQLQMAWIIGAIGGLGASLVVSFMRSVNPVFVVAYALLEGLFVGAISKWCEAMAPGAVVGAVMGTIAVFAATLAAYKFLNIQVTNKFRKFVTIAMMGMMAVLLLDFVLFMFGAAIGFGGFGALGFITSIVGVVLGAFMLILDFDMVERGIEAGLPEKESWRAAFGLAVTLIWIYVNLLKIITILSQD